MTVKIKFPNRNAGDQTCELSLEVARDEVQIAVENGYLPVYNGKSILVSDIKDGQEITLVPVVRGG
jgi:hypothetical protein